MKKETLRALVLDAAQLARVGGGSVLCNRGPNNPDEVYDTSSAASLTGSRKC